ncbi:hypothetical protein RM780_10125 [Streptomyces sp. DSM 44917]|uniref:Uncharacterized protein n=1 Tax=Streptomyces boetiae TaxID=3075541 RepID=A0ABU2L6X1_9ACTN|nr:hypothetical protein [Streptomyces sp. DSM 44917]MDT0307319.1 hypothetical protein [Streptomyces sp. DSM 44917]
MESAITIRRPGRQWTVRLDPHGRPALGISKIVCSSPRCAPDPRRFRDPLLARMAALAHVREHILHAGAPNCDASCRCAGDNCTRHPRLRRCAGPPALTLVPDLVGRLWVLAEMCAACAAAIPRAKILAGGRPQPRVPRPAPAIAPPASRRGTSTLPDAIRARSCPVCAAEAEAIRQARITETEETSTNPGASLLEPQKWQVPTDFGDRTGAALAYLADQQAGRTPEARLLALLCALGRRRDDFFLATSEHLHPDWMGLGDAAFEELVAIGWLEASLTEVRAAVPGKPPAVCRMPHLATDQKPFNFSKDSRKQFNGWIQRLAGHHLLAGQPAGVRLGALYVTARCLPTGRGVVGPRAMARLCCYSCSYTVLPVLDTLARVGWLEKVESGTTPDRPVTFTLAPAARAFIPGAQPQGRVATGTPTRAVPINLRAREMEIAAWVDAYVARHRHGPPNRDLITAHQAEDPQNFWPEADILRAVAALGESGWLLVDSNRWYRTRPGPTYWKRLAAQQAEQKPTASPDIATARTPRSSGPSQRRVAATAPASVPVPSPKTHPAPWTPVSPRAKATATQRAVPTRSDRASTSQHPGLWLIPGAEAILGPPPCPEAPSASLPQDGRYDEPLAANRTPSRARYQ